ncbi:hypothetical protein BJ508DRAFT_304061 [Ascobolus immersus RN42]|uniref:DUF202 domain-containing protein n=1 Tax=Ascobolus immersus RN42 TaxID=1160509 RepID=A0A3N4IF65_ASCIM|nr:hypothetical protein BJ508DRAFT_304061 [Ascobolus immersus RN42]
MSALFRNTLSSMSSLPGPHRRRKKHKKRVRPPPPSPEELLELRAAHRTFEGAYFRTAVSQLSFSLVILKIFSSEFYSIGALFAAFGALVLLIAIWRRHMAVAQVEDINGALGENQERKGDTGRGVLGGRFRTSGGVVLVISIVSASSYILLMWLILRIGNGNNKQVELAKEMQAEREELHSYLY